MCARSAPRTTTRRSSFELNVLTLAGHRITLHGVGHPRSRSRAVPADVDQSLEQATQPLPLAVEDSVATKHGDQRREAEPRAKAVGFLIAARRRGDSSNSRSIASTFCSEIR